MKLARWGLLVLFIGAGLVVISYRPLKKVLQVLTGFTAKYTCSHVFLADFPLDKALEGLSYLPVGLMDIQVDDQGKSTIVSMLGVKQTAYYYDWGRFCGCALYKAPKLRRVPQSSPSTDLWPFGESLNDSLQNVEKAISIQEYLEKVTQNEKDLLAITVAHADGWLAESYGVDVKKDDLLLGWSMTKSFLTVLYGLVDEKGSLNLDEKPLRSVLNGEGKENTYRNLLQMNAGLDWEEHYGKVSPATSMLYLSENVAGVALNRSSEALPGQHWEYSSGTSNILSHLLREDMGEDFYSFISDSFFNRVGMRSALVETDASGLPVMSSYGWATARDWTRFGLLFLNKGMWGQDTIFTRDWFEFVTSEAPNSDGQYGGQIWLSRTEDYPDLPEDAFYARGYGGQRVMIIPSRDVVITTLCGYTEDLDFNGLYRDILERL
jgi:CubicO group peptidase (beta-lactamase class C family)